MQHQEIFDVVDENDNVIGTMTRKESKTNGKKYRIVRVMVSDGQGNFLLQKRVSTKDTYPNCWDNSAAGHVDAGETYDDAAHRELTEEIGLKDVDLKEVLYYYSETVSPAGYTLNRFTRLYIATVPRDTHFSLQESEVSEVKWVTPEEIGELVREDGVVTDGLKQVYERYFS